MDLTWIKQHKWVVAVFGAAAGGYVLYSFLHRSSTASGTASSVVGGDATGQAGSPQYLVPVVQSAGPVGTSTSPVSNVPVPNQPGPTTPTHGQPPKTSAVIALNPYGVGTKVTSDESITQSVYDPLFNSWIDLTSKGGIYTSPGTAISGSAFSPQWTGNGRVVLAQGGAAVQEYNAAGKLVGTFKVEK